MVPLLRVYFGGGGGGGGKHSPLGNWPSLSKADEGSSVGGGGGAVSPPLPYILYGAAPLKIAATVNSGY